MDKTYAIIIFNPATGKEETVPVTKEVYDEFRRDAWRNKKSDDKYISHTYPMSCLNGGDAEDSFHEFEDKGADLEELIIQNERLECLRFALSQLSKSERALIYDLYMKGLSERAVAENLGVCRNTVHYQKIKILEKLKKFF